MTDDRRQDLKARYGFEFPPDFVEFWEFARQCDPAKPCAAFWDALGLTLVGPFEVLAGRFEGKIPQHRYFAALALPVRPAGVLYDSERKHRPTALGLLAG
jgi:hypothetical protein